MKYLYYPGCSLEGTALEYNLSTMALMRAMDAELIELEDWTCCGASAAEPMSYLLSLALPARNLAVAEGMEGVRVVHDVGDLEAAVRAFLASPGLRSKPSEERQPLVAAVREFLAAPAA